VSGFSARDRAVAGVTARQRTMVSTEQLTACGLGKDAVAYRVQSGRFRPVFQGVYSVCPGELPPLALEQAALLACGERSFISHQSAAFVWGMRKTPPAEVEVSVIGRNCWRREGLRVHRIGAIDKREVRRERGLWVSSPARTVLEIAATGTRDELIEAIDAGLAARRFKPKDLQVVLERNRPCRGRPGWLRCWGMRRRWRSAARALRWRCCGSSGMRGCPYRRRT
jgi:hypothetical protein